MKFDVTQFSVAPGEDVEIVFVNKDHMPHNLLVTAPGKLEDVSLKAEAMVEPARRVPEALRAGHARRPARHELINHDEIARLRFSAPTAQGQVPLRLHVPRPLADDERRDGRVSDERRSDE